MTDTTYLQPEITEDGSAGTASRSLPERDDTLGSTGPVATEPVRTLATAPATVLGLAAAVTALGVGDPVVAIAIAAGLIVLVGLLELVRSKVTPAG